MSRPETIEDLPRYYRQDETVATINLNEVKFGTSTINAYRLVAELAQEFESLGFKVELDANSLTTTRPQTEDELNRKLESNQRSWDLSEEAYNQGLADPTLFSVKDTYKRSWANNHAIEEKLPKINWIDAKDEEDNADQD